MTRQIIDNFLSDFELQIVKGYLLDVQFPWSVNHAVVDDPLCDPKYNFQFTHTFYLPPKIKSEYLHTVGPILEKLQPTALFRTKANLTTVTPEIIVHGYHTDLHPNVAKVAKTAVFYLNTNDGYTIFEDGEKVESVENRILIFDAHEVHSGTTCTDQSYRAVLNINFIP